MPFDTENYVKWDSNYIKGYTSEKRDTNVEQLKPLVEKQAKDIAKFAANDTLQQYDRGVAYSCAKAQSDTAVSSRPGGKSKAGEDTGEGGTDTVCS